MGKDIARKVVIAAALGNDVHVAGVLAFLRLAESLGYDIIFLGPAVDVADFVKAVEEHKPDVVGVSYRLTPEVGARLVEDLMVRLDEKGLRERRFVFGGTPPVCRAVEASGLFERSFTGLEPPEDVMAYLSGSSSSSETHRYEETQIERLKDKSPYPMLRHHFGLPTLEATISGVKKIAEANVLDVISLAPDQNAQESFFRPEEMVSELDGAGGVPVRTADDLRAIYTASRCGNYPLLRIYSGTRDLLKWAELALETINNAWGAIPLCWYSTLDGRSKRSVTEAIAENQAAMRWYALRGLPVEVNESHHWSLRDAHDAIAVAMAYLAAYNAKQTGVKHYIAQYMFNTPPSTYDAMDLAKMLAKVELIESLHDENFFSMRQVRAGLLSLSPDLDVAKGQLAASTLLALNLKPHIIHVVGYTEGDHAATADEVIESCKIVRGVVKNCLFGMPNSCTDEQVIARKEELVAEATQIIESIKLLGNREVDPLTSPEILSLAMKIGILDAPQLAGNAEIAGKVKTACIGGAIYAVDPETKKPLSESERIKAFLR